MKVVNSLIKRNCELVDCDAYHNVQIMNYLMHSILVLHEGFY